MPFQTEQQWSKSLKHLNGRHVIASVSGGKDSLAMCLYLKERGVPFSCLFMNTGWEAPDTYEYLRGPLTKAIGPITEIKADKQMIELVLHKGMFPSRMRRFCSEKLKVKPLIKHLNALLESGVESVNAVGLRAGENAFRATLTEWEWCDGFEAETWRPCLPWTEQDVIDMIKKHNVPPNPLYLKGATRVGCWPCIFARKEEIRFLAEQDPGRIEFMEQWEAQVAEKAKARAEAKGEKLANNPAFFQARDGDGRCVPIKEVVAWSKTGRGGRQFELLATAPEGCVRWGLCETPE